MLAVALALIALALAGWLVSMRQAASPLPDDVSFDEDGFPDIDWEYWRSVNPDVIGWVTVPGTDIDQPIVQASTSDPTYYLHHDVYGKWSVYGCPYLDAECAEEGLDSDNAVVFGHHMNDGSMFADFAGYSDAGFAASHRKVLLQTPDSKRVLSVSFSRVIDAEKTVKRTSFADAADFADWYASELEAAAVTLTAEIPSQNTTFVTCSYSRFSNERTLVFASTATVRGAG